MSKLDIGLFLGALTVASLGLVLVVLQVVGVI